VRGGDRRGPRLGDRHRPAEPEAFQGDPTVPADEDVLRRHVAVDDAVRGGGAQRTGDRVSDRRGHRRGDGDGLGPGAGLELRERHSGEPLGGEIRLAGFLAAGHDGRDVRARQRSGAAPFLQERGPDSRIAGVGGQQSPQRHRPGRRALAEARPADLEEAGGGEHLLELERPEGLRRGVHGLRRYHAGRRARRGASPHRTVQNCS
jgi:hypothetical protein